MTCIKEQRTANSGFRKWRLTSKLKVCASNYLLYRGTVKSFSITCRASPKTLTIKLYNQANINRLNEINTMTIFSTGKNQP